MGILSCGQEKRERVAPFYSTTALRPLAHTANVIFYSSRLRHYSFVYHNKERLNSIERVGCLFVTVTAMKIFLLSGRCFDVNCLQNKNLSLKYHFQHVKVPVNAAKRERASD
jgi:hypothetical protein